MAKHNISFKDALYIGWAAQEDKRSMWTQPQCLYTAQAAEFAKTLDDILCVRKEGGTWQKSDLETERKKWLL